MTHYHNYAETTELLKDFTNKYEGLCKLYSIGKSFQGKEIWCMEVTNYASGAPETKPGMYNNGRINEHLPGNARTATKRNYPAYWAPDMSILKY